MAVERDRERKPARIIGAILVALLPIIAIAVAIKSRRFDPSLFETPIERKTPGIASSLSVSTQVTAVATSPSSTSLAESRATTSAIAGTGTHQIPAAIIPPMPANTIYRIDEPPQFFDTKTVFDKIDGGAPEFLDLGFRALVTQAYAPLDAARFGCELFIYDMSEPKNARKIFEQQRSQDAKPEQIGEGGCRFAATWFFHQGPYYVIVSNSDEGPDAERFSQQLALAVAGRIASKR